MDKLKPKSLLSIPMQVDFETGRSVKNISEVLDFKKGTIIKLDDSEKNVIQVYVNGVLHAFGKAVRKDGEMYVKVLNMNQNREG